jgi:cysteine desulfurase
MRSAFEGAVIARVPGVTVHGGGAARLPNTSNLGFDGVDAEMLALNLDLLGVAASMGSACSSSDREPSRVLLAMGCTAAEARSSLRFSFGRTNTDEDVERAVGALEQSVAALRAGGGR